MEDQDSLAQSEDLTVRLEYFDMPPYRYCGNIPEGFSRQMDPNYSITTTSLANDGLRSIDGHADILEIKTTDPNAKLFILRNSILGYGIQKDVLIIPLVPGTHRILKSLIPYSGIFIEHSQFPDYTSARYCVGGNTMRKIYRLKVYSRISGKEYYYKEGRINIAETPLDLSPVKIAIPPQQKLPEYQKCCPLCKQKLPDLPAQRAIERKNRKRRPDLYPFSFKRKMNAIVESGFLFVESYGAGHYTVDV